MKQIKGIGVSSGVAIGKAWIWENSFLKQSEYSIDESMVNSEIERFNESIRATEVQIRELQKNFEHKVGSQYSDIFSFHLAFLKDNLLKKETENMIRAEKINSESALTKVIQKLGREFKKKEADFLKDRRRDLLDVIEKIVLNLKGTLSAKIKTFKDEIIIARDLSPSQTVSLDRNYVIGFVTEIGSETSHAAIIAKALEIPAVVACDNAVSEIRNGDIIIIDGTAGIVIVNPARSVIEKYKGRKKQLLKLKEKLLLLKNLPCQTIDGKRIVLHANIEMPEEVATARRYGAEGIGLYRTEYLYINRTDLPSEEEQFFAYKNVAEKTGSGRPVIIRTVDIGGDKFISALPATGELNPFLGWRGIRFCLERKDIFETQLRAILRAAVYGNLKIMFPMISTIEEIREAKKVLHKVCSELKKEKKKFNERLEVGIMVETPSAALMTDQLARESDFFSIGSNDLIQYTLAVDRGNEKISYLYQPCHPAVLKLIKTTVENSVRNNIWTGLCGEMASIPEMACLLVGMGIDELSMAPSAIPAVKERIRASYYGKLKEIVKNALLFDTHDEVHNYLLSRID